MLCGWLDLLPAKDARGDLSVGGLSSLRNASFRFRVGKFGVASMDGVEGWLERFQGGGKLRLGW